MKCKNCQCDYEFYGQRHQVCRECKRVYDREYHTKRTAAQKHKKTSQQKTRRIDNRKYILEYLKTHPCECCGETDPVVLEFDHIDPTTKEYTISLMVMHSKENIDKEIAKCRVLCANCHRRHTAKQMGWYNF